MTRQARWNKANWNISISHRCCPYKAKSIHKSVCGRHGNKSPYEHPDPRATCTKEHCPIVEEFEEFD